MVDDNSDTREVPAATPWDQPPPPSGPGWNPPPPPRTVRPAAPQPRPQPPRRKSRIGLALVLIALVGLVGAGLVVLFVLAALAGATSYHGPGLAGYQQYTVEEGTSANRILLINIEGVITTGEGCAPLALAQLRQLRTANEPSGVRAVLIRVNSPGGTVTACDKIDGEIQKCITEKRLPFVAYYDEVAASGGYYVSARAKPIVAQPTCVVGSIGVIGLNLNIQKLLNDKLGIHAEAIKSVPFKDVPSMFRPMKDEERAYVQKMVDDYHARFRGVVQSGRGLKAAEVDAFADGRVFLAKDAKALKMIDQVGDWDDAVKAARQIVDPKAPVIGYRRRPSTLELMLESRSSSGIPEDLRLKIKVAAQQRFCYLWLP